MKTLKRRGTRGKVRNRRRKTSKRGGAVETKVYPDGTYVGNIENDMRETYRRDTGKMTYNNGDVYEGPWQNDMRNGYNAKLTYAANDAQNRVSYEGDFVNDQLDHGEMKYTNGDVYVGDFVNDVKENWGQMRYANGEIYIGNWRNEKRDTSPAIPGDFETSARMVYSDGRMEEGYWLNDEFVRPRPPPPPRAPRRFIPLPLPPVDGRPPVVVDANQIHKFTKNIDFTKLNAFLNDHSSQAVPYVDQPERAKVDDPDVGFGVYIKDSMDKIIRSADNAKIEERVKDFKRLIEETLDKTKYYVFSDNLLTGVFLSLKYAQLQPEAFKEAYVQSYLDDTCKAYNYNNAIDNFSCPAGTFERFVTSLAPAATTVLSSGQATEEQKQEYEKLVEMITRNLETLIPNLIREWQRSHKNGVGLESIVGDEQRRANLKAYIEETVTNNTPEVNALIEKLIKEYADSVGYDNEELQLGGKRTRKRRRKGTKKMTKTRKRKVNRKIRKR